jgi:hypothetical protein
LRLSKNAEEDRNYFETIVSDALYEFLDDDDGSILSLPAEILAAVHPAIRHRLIRAVFARLGLKQDIAAVHLASADKLLKTWQEGGEASGKRVEFPLDYTFGVVGKNAVFRPPDSFDPEWKPRRKK